MPAFIHSIHAIVYNNNNRKKCRISFVLVFVAYPNGVTISLHTFMFGAINNRLWNMLLLLSRLMNIPAAVTRLMWEEISECGSEWAYFVGQRHTILYYLVSPKFNRYRKVKTMLLFSSLDHFWRKPRITLSLTLETENAIAHEPISQLPWN